MATPNNPSLLDAARAVEVFLQGTIFEDAPEVEALYAAIAAEEQRTPSLLDAARAALTALTVGVVTRGDLETKAEAIRALRAAIAAEDDKANGLSERYECQSCGAETSRPVTVQEAIARRERVRGTR